MAFSKTIGFAYLLFAGAALSMGSAGAAAAAQQDTPARANPALSEPQRAAAAAGGKAGTASEMSTSAQSGIFQFALQNGLQVVVIPDHRAPVVTQMVWYRVGGYDDPPGVSGLAHFFEHMMFRGTKALPGDGFSRSLAKNGGVDNAFTTEDYTAFYSQIAADRLPLAMRLEADRMANLDLSDKAVPVERDVVMEERRMRIDNDPEAQLSEQMAAALHLSHPYGRPVIGWMNEIAHIDRVAASNFYLHHYGPNNAILVVAGDVTADAVRADALATFGKLPPRSLAPRADYSQPPRLGPSRLTMSSAAAKLSVFMRDYRVVSYPEARPGQAEALDVLAQILGGDSNSALYQALVVKEKLATDVGASYDGERRDSGNFALYAVPRPGVGLERLEKAADAVVERYRHSPPSAAELTRAKTQLIADAIYRRDSQYAQASAYGQALAIGLTVQDVQDWPQRIGHVSLAAVTKAANDALTPAQSVTGWLEPKAGK